MFPQGPPGIGLVVLRAAVAILVIRQAIADVLIGASPYGLGTVAAVSALFLLVGLWTPVAGVTLAVVELTMAVLQPAERGWLMQNGAVGCALAMLGPGAWSVDARLYGRKNLHIPDRPGT